MDPTRYWSGVRTRRFPSMSFWARAMRMSSHIASVSPDSTMTAMSTRKSSLARPRAVSPKRTMAAGENPEATMRTASLA